MFAENGDRTMLNDIAAYNAEMKGIEERSEAKDAEKTFSLDDLTPKQLAYTKALMDNLGITDESVLYQVARNQFGTGEQLDSNAMNQTFARKDGRSLLSAIGEVGKIQDYQQPQEAPTDPEPTPPTPPDILDGRGLTDIIKEGEGPAPTIPPIFDVDPNMSEVDSLKEQYRMMESQRFIVDPGPEHWKGLQALANQIKALDPSFESSWLTSTPAPSPDPGPAPTPPDMPPGYPFEEGPRDGQRTDQGPIPPPGFTHSNQPSTFAMVPFYNPTTGEEWTATNGGWIPAPGWVQGRKPADWKPPTSADPAPTQPDMPVQPGPDPLPESPAPKPPTIIDMDPLKGMRDQFVPRNILGQSYDPQVREDFIKKMQSGANITSTPSYQMPTSPIPQTQFGGYGQPMPMSALAPYAGLGAAPFRPTDYDEPYDEDALPGGPSGPRDGGGVI